MRRLTCRAAAGVGVISSSIDVSVTLSMPVSSAMGCTDHPLCPIVTIPLEGRVLEWL